ncbi:hypothetical protein [Methylibium rhizosphaerae]|uniref:hypothetical protein n=1 Tax=Methylibium rhizosphaerae TaxID=2570323 RepID=UPI00112DBE9C|nr:hypothetical protein [Methylibium rhizosphaerae]
MRIAKRLEDSMQQAQENKVVVEAEAIKEVDRKTAEQQAPVQLDAELLRFVGGGNTSAPSKTW